MAFVYDGGGLGKGGAITLYLDGRKDGDGRVEQTMPFLFSLDETCDVGRDAGTPVSPDYDLDANEFSGEVNWVELAIDEATATDDQLARREERFQIALIRQ